MFTKPAKGSYFWEENDGTDLVDSEDGIRYQVFRLFVAFFEKNVNRKLMKKLSSLIALSNKKKGPVLSTICLQQGCGDIIYCHFYSLN